MVVIDLHWKFLTEQASRLNSVSRFCSQIRDDEIDIKLHLQFSVPAMSLVWSSLVSDMRRVLVGLFNKKIRITTTIPETFTETIYFLAPCSRLMYVNNCYYSKSSSRFLSQDSMQWQQRAVRHGAQVARRGLVFHHCRAKKNFLWNILWVNIILQSFRHKGY